MLDAVQAATQDAEQWGRQPLMDPHKLGDDCGRVTPDTALWLFRSGPLASQAALPFGHPMLYAYAGT
jgi:hypothetical protein